MEFERYVPYKFNWSILRDQVITEESCSSSRNIKFGELIDFLIQHTNMIELEEHFGEPTIKINGSEYRYESNDTVVKRLITFVAQIYAGNFDKGVDLKLYFLAKDYLVGGMHSFNRFFIFNNQICYPINFPDETTSSLSMFILPEEETYLSSRSSVDRAWLDNLFAYRNYYSTHPGTEREKLDLLNYEILDEELIIHSQDFYRDYLIKKQNIFIGHLFELGEYAVIGIAIIIVILGYIAYKS